jgi:glycosyltransferase 2 family protein
LTADAKRRLKLLAKLAIFGVVLYFISDSLAGGWNSLQNQIHVEKTWSPNRIRWPWLLAAAVIYLAGQLPNGLFWHRILGSLGQHVPLGATLRAFYIGHLGKYVPGKAMVVVMRTGMLVPHGARPAAAAVSVFYETLTMMAVGAVLSAVIVAARFRDHAHYFEWLLGALAMVVITGLPVMPPVFTRIIRVLRVDRTEENAASAGIGRIPPLMLIRGWLLMAVGWILSGLSIAAVFRGAGFDYEVGFFDQLVRCTAAAALAVVTGFVSQVPGGFGVREFVIQSVLETPYGKGVGLVVGVLVRLVWLVAELSVSVILYKSGTRPRPGELPGASPAPPPAKA